MATKKTKITKATAGNKPKNVLDVSEYAKRHHLDAKVVRRRLRAVANKPKSGWRITPALAAKLEQ